MIIVKGIKSGKEMIVKYNDKSFTFNNEENEALSFELETILNRKLPVFGTYCADDDYDELYILGILKEHFFEKEPEIISIGEIQIDWENEVY